MPAQRTAATVHGPDSPGLALRQLETAVNQYLGWGIAKSTHKSYNSGQQQYFRFCQQTGLEPLPASEQQLMLFSAFLALKGCKWQTIKCYLSAVRHLHIVQGSPSSALEGARPRLQLLLRGIRRAAADKPRRPRLPITPAILRKVWQVIRAPPHSHDQVMIWAAMNTCFFGFLRAGEICTPTTSSFDPSWHLCLGDVALDSHAAPSKIYVTIKASTLGKTNHMLCPMTSILPYLARRGSSAGPLFQFQDGSFLTREKFVSEVRQLLMAAGIDPEPYAGHSFRIGAATTAAQAGMDAPLIQTLGRWKSSAYQLYIRIPRESLASVSSVIAAMDN